MKEAFWENNRSNFYTNLLFCAILFVDVVLIFVMNTEISIHHKEAAGIFYSHKLAYEIARFSLDIFGQNDYALRLPFILLHICNMILLFLISRIYCKKPYDALMVVLVYALLPGVIFSSLLVLKSGLIIFITLLCCYIQIRFHRFPYVVLFIAVFIDESFAILFFAFFFYALKTKNTLAMLISLVFFALNMYMFGLDISGKPRSYFVYNLGIMALFFSPLLLLYYIYTILNALRKQINLLVDIGATSLFFVLLLSLRQNVDLETLFPMSVVALPVVIKQFFSDIRIRLPAFRLAYLMRFVVIFSLLVLQSGVLYANKILYLFGTKHFASSYYISKELASALKDRGLDGVKTSNYKLELALRFYGISHHSQWYLLPSPDLHETYENEIPIVYWGKKVASYVLVPSLHTKPLTKAQSRLKSQSNKLSP
ncbi:hypothetical protein LS68_000505 [Helicobacter sp. MIT 05-5293]|uniref:hypothetical protein n=1 Tax=Helicobacter sp. MIT 05-5293 TaxID=1548149 RepID=UPI00051DCAC5|nr:hypothetical protein [Helicobacter sp. MIT 05-5293]TLD81552.1 hypothetical protein LS68_000505 [Helicobacter sp. MIT 05-5293]